VDAEQAGQRLDNFLLRQFKGIPKGRIYKMLRKGEVRRNGSRCKAADRLIAGDQVRLPPVRDGDGPGEAPSVPRWAIDRLAGAFCYSDAELAVLNKPAGLAVHGGSGLAFGVIEALAAGWPETDWGLAHRLDRWTSGCLVVGKRGGVTRGLQQAFAGPDVAKAYLVLVAGEWVGGAREIAEPLGPGPRVQGKRITVVDRESGREARTTFKPLRYWKGFTLLRAELGTGRTHQIRAHARAAGFPVAGDPLYGDEAANEALAALSLQRIFLHSVSVGLTHPVSSAPLEVECPLPEDLRAVLEALEARSSE
jgi:23S rRNA pseudouridine955/2504/2580 synthase